jgi:hypothetical protein
MDVKFWKEFAEKWNDEVVKPIQNRSEEKVRLIKASDIKQVHCQINCTDFIGVEFELKDDVFVEEADDIFSLFRIEHYTNGEVAVSVANWDEYCIHEDATNLFDVQDLCEELIFKQLDCYDATDDFIQYVEESENE